MSSDRLDLLISPKYTRVTIAPETLRKLWVWTAAADTEISALGEVDLHENAASITDEIHLLKQTGSAGHTELDQAAVADLIMRQMQAGKDPGRIRLWWH